METKWTPGPWRVVPPDESGEEEWGVCIVDPGPGWVYIAEHVSQNESEHNAGLIAAAPDLYEEHYSDDQLLMQMATVVLDEKISAHIPAGLKDAVEKRLRRGSPALAKAARWNRRPTIRSPWGRRGMPAPGVTRGK